MRKWTAAAAATLLLVLGTAQAQPTENERVLASVFANEVDGILITCPDGYPITDLASCFLAESSLSHTSTLLNFAWSGFSDVSTPLPWTRSDNGRLMSRVVQIEGRPIVQVFLIERDTFETVVWVIEMDRFPE